jgi:LmbE family N-acetylglucosaminyl deacetylase
VKKPADVLVVAAHPDDAEYGAAGSVARWTEADRQVVYAVCTNGEKGTGDRAMRPEQLAEIRRREQQAAAAVLGVREVVFLGYPDQELEDAADLRKQVVRLIRTYRPHTVVTSDPYRRYLWHRDHRIIGQVVMDAVFPFARDHLSFPDLLAEGLEPHKTAEILFWAAEDMNHRIDITATFDRKIAALRCHASQLKGSRHKDPVGYLKERCRQMAAGENYELAEGFHRVELPT